MRALLCLVLLVSAVASGAQSSTVVVGMGNCADAELIGHTRRVSEHLSRQDSLDVVVSELVESRLGAEPRRSVEEIQRQIDSAQQLFYQAQYLSSLERLNAALLDVNRLPPGAERWQLSVSAHLLEGLLRARLRDGKRDSELAYRYVLRLDPKYQLDPDYFSPSTLKEFDRIRKAVDREPRHKLTIRSNPPGAPVYLDGREMGRAPLELKLPADDYVVQVGQAKRFSIPRVVELKESQDVAVELRFEGAIANRRPLCFESNEPEEKRLRDGTRLGSLLGVEQVVILRHESREIGPGWLSATLVDAGSGRKIREGGLEIRADAVDEDALDDLSRFIATGEKTPKVREVSPAQQAAPVAGAPTPPTASVAAEVPTAEQRSSPGSWRRTSGLTFTGGGVLFALGGVTCHLLSASAQSEFDRLSEGGVTVDERVAAANARDRAGALRPWMYAGYGVGAAALVGGLLLLATAPPDSAPTSMVVVSPSLEGGAAGAVLSGPF